MTLTIPVSPELKDRLSAAAQGVGVSPEVFAAGILERHFPLVPPSAERRAALRVLLESWRHATDEEAKDQQETLEALVQGLDASRPGQRPHFPPELKGVTW